VRRPRFRRWQRRRQCPPFLPASPAGLLQTEGYARQYSLLLFPRYLATMLSARLAARMDSQQSFLRDDSRRFSSLMPEHSSALAGGQISNHAPVQCAHMRRSPHGSRTLKVADHPAGNGGVDVPLILS